MISNKRFYYINSRERVTGTDEDFTFTLQIPPTGNFTHAVLLDVLIPKTYYLIQEGRNKFQLIEDGTTVDVELPLGNYGYTTFKNTLIEILNQISPNGWIYDVEIPEPDEPTTGKYVFMVSNNLSGEQPTFKFNTTDLFEQFGFAAGSTMTFTMNRLESTAVVKFDREDALYIHSDLVSNGTDSILQEIYVNEEDFGAIHWRCPDVIAYSKKLVPTQSNIYNFKLTDEDGNKIILNNMNMVMTLLLFKVDDLFGLSKHFFESIGTLVKSREI